MFKSLRVLFSAVLVTMIVMTSACGGSSTPAATTIPALNTATSPTVAIGNQAPVINKLTAKPETVKPDEITEMSCEATDANGDTLTYSWAASGGDFTTEAITKQYWINWRAPKLTGNFNITVNVTDGKGGSATRSYTMGVFNNRAPVISGIDVKPTEPKPGDSCTLTAAVSDPDGDTITYKWLTNAGKVVGSGNVGTWLAPADGIYEIQLEASDGKDGGTSNFPLKITVKTPSNSLTIPYSAAESGTVLSDSVVASTFYRVGDDENNKGLRAFFSFDLAEIKSATISSATLTFTVKQTVGAPFAITPPFLYIEPVYYGPRALKGADYEMSTAGAQIDKLDSKTPGQYDVTGPISDAASSGRYQLRIRLGGTTNSNKIADYIEFTGASLSITFQK
jgi:hypothetical protein